MDQNSKLRELAIKASQNSHSPYSNAKVGSALLTESGITSMVAMLKTAVLVELSVLRELLSGKLFQKVSKK